MAKEAFRGPLEQVDECCWRIPRSYKQGMRVDGMIFASAQLMHQIGRDQAPDQVANVAHLPGIQLASLAMPDIHWGYGFCIGGVAATDPEEGGVICPGGIGYDINCLAGSTLILDGFGRRRRIEDMAVAWRRTDLACLALEEGRRTTAPILQWFGQSPREEVLRVRTEAGDEVEATADHPFWTPHGMVPLGHLSPGDLVAMAPFAGVEYTEPSNDVVLSEDDFLTHWEALGKSTSDEALRQVLPFLRERSLLPLRYSSPALPYLCKVLGFVFGDGYVRFQDGKGIVGFNGDSRDLETIRSDLEQLGVTPSRVYSRERHHTIQTAYAEYEFDRTEEWFKVIGSSFAVLLAALGAPVGRKPSQDYDVPSWLAAAPLWQRRLFLAAYFGAEMTAPACVPAHGTVFAQPTVSMNKRPDFVESGRRFLNRLAEWLADFGVVVQPVLVDEAQVNADGERSLRLRLVISNTTENLLALWSQVGYEYNQKRSGLAALAVQYLKHKQIHLAARTSAAEEARALRRQGVSLGGIATRLSRVVNRRFVERALYSSQEAEPRVAKGFPTFAAYAKEASAGTERGGMVWERIATIDPVPDFQGRVYDFTVGHDDHNFIAGNFVVSNCGVRLVRSNLFYRDVKPVLKPLVEELFRSVPSGVGRSGRYKFNTRELRQLLNEGPRALMSRGFCTQGDLDYTEAGGRLDGADPDAVSERALTRGEDQCGTLGSGNHFLEVQIVDHVFDEAAAKVLGLEKDMVCVMIHSGSRGLGYQVCEDSLIQLRKAPEKYGIEVPDRQLACAPVDSPEGRHYIGAMRAAANFAWCNRQLLMHQAREVFARVFEQSWQELHMNLVYDVCHNIAKFEEHTVNGKLKRLWVHRKGATRAFPPGHLEVPDIYRGIGQPVIIPGDMGRASWVLVGQPGSMERTFGTTCHGAGRAMSRTAAMKDGMGRRIDKELESRGVIARAQSRKGLAEEQPKAYKNVDDVVDVVHRAGLSHKVARMRPIGVIKG